LGFVFQPECVNIYSFKQTWQRVMQRTLIVIQQIKSTPGYKRLKVSLIYLAVVSYGEDCVSKHSLEIGPKKVDRGHIIG
jgi:hypothetical protein